MTVVLVFVESVIFIFQLATVWRHSFLSALWWPIRQLLNARMSSGFFIALSLNPLLLLCCCFCRLLILQIALGSRLLLLSAWGETCRFLGRFTPVSLLYLGFLSEKEKKNNCWLHQRAFVKSFITVWYIHEYTPSNNFSKSCILWPTFLCFLSCTQIYFTLCIATERSKTNLKYI